MTLPTRTDADLASVRLGYGNDAPLLDPVDEDELERKEEEDDAPPVRRWDPALRGYVPTDGNWPERKRRSHIRSSQGRGRSIPSGIDPRVPTDDDCDVGEDGDGFETVGGMTGYEGEEKP